MEFDVHKNTIYYCLHGSHAYGMATPESDKDFKGIAIAPLDYYLGFSKKFEQAEKYESKGADKDEVIYDIQKFAYLASQTNPNVLEILFADKEHVLKCSPAGLKLRKNAGLFISAKAKHTFTGYAHAQLKRIKSHREWLLNPPTKKPTREEFGLSNDHKKLNATDMGAYEKMIEEGEKFPEEIMSLLDKERRYKAAMTYWSQYENWTESRNPKRAEIEKKFGYDTKHGAHLVRLLRMGEEILQGKGVIVYRPDAKELLSIRNGAWSYDELIQYSEAMDKRTEELYNGLRDQPEDKRIIPMKCDLERINNIIMDCIMEFHNIVYMVDVLLT